MDKRLRNILLTTLAAALMLTASAFVYRTVDAGPALHSANGEGTLFRQNESGDDVRRHFSLSAKQLNAATGAAQGNAILHNPAFTGSNGTSPYMLQIDIRCMKVIGNFATFGGLTRRTNDPTLVDAVFFSVQDNGEPGKGTDQISPVFFWDGDPNSVGKEMNCVFNDQTSFPVEIIESGNIQVK
jgi:hypothetical protein